MSPRSSILPCCLLGLSCAVRPVATGATGERGRSSAAGPVVAPSHVPGAAGRADAGDEGAPVEHDAGGSDVEAGAAPPVNANATCPEGMLRVRHDFCPDLTRTCTREEYEPSNHLEICHEYERGSETCNAPRVALDFCIDRYEFPNEKGAHPPVMVDYHAAQAACAARGRRLCFEREWTAACEGPEESPFPYGWQRSSAMCNIDNRWIAPRLRALYSVDPSVRERELARLDQSVPSGSREGCRSGFGVHDLTGNFDEWATADRERPQEHGKGAALKGGAWGHVRNACRPVTTSHAPNWRYYFVSFRCCRDAVIP